MLKLIKRSKKYISRGLFTYLVTRNAISVDGELYVNRFSVVNKNTKLGANVHFNGMKIRGTGLVRVGDNFHSGEECLILTDMFEKMTSNPPHPVKKSKTNIKPDSPRIHPTHLMERGQYNTSPLSSQRVSLTEVRKFSEISSP